MTLGKLFCINPQFIYKFKGIVILNSLYLANIVNLFLGLISASAVHTECDCKCTQPRRRSYRQVKSGWVQLHNSALHVCGPWTVVLNGSIWFFFLLENSELFMSNQSMSFLNIMLCGPRRLVQVVGGQSEVFQVKLFWFQEIRGPFKVVQETMIVGRIQNNLTETEEGKQSSCPQGKKDQGRRIKVFILSLPLSPSLSPSLYHVPLLSMNLCPWFSLGIMVAPVLTLQDSLVLHPIGYSSQHQPTWSSMSWILNSQQSTLIGPITLFKQLPLAEPCTPIRSAKTKEYGHVGERSFGIVRREQKD